MSNVNYVFSSQGGEAKLKQRLRHRIKQVTVPRMPDEHHAMAQTKEFPASTKLIAEIQVRHLCKRRLVLVPRYEASGPWRRQHKYYNKGAWHPSPVYTHQLFTHHPQQFSITLSLFGAAFSSPVFQPPTTHSFIFTLSFPRTRLIIDTMHHQNLLTLLCLSLWAAVSNAQFRVWRGDTRDPTSMRAAGVFAPRGASRLLEIMPNISLWNHANGADSGGSQDDDGYVSTTSNETVAVGFLNDFFGGNGYVYEIAATGNFINVAGSLEEYEPFPDEREYAALGGFQWDQVIRWTRYVDGVADSAGLQDNTEYDEVVYQTLRPTDAAPELAGFPDNHEAWSISPWSAFALGGQGCGAPPRRSLRARQEGGCRPSDTNEEAAKKWVDKNCFTDSKCG